MTTIVLVSHSEDIANGGKALLEQMVEGITVIAIGGHEGSIGTSFDRIQEGLKDLTEDALCFYDIGSASMNLDMAIEMYDGQYRVEKLEAPIIEGSFFAAVNLSTNTNLDDVIEIISKEFSR